MNDTLNVLEIGKNKVLFSWTAVKQNRFLFATVLYISSVSIVLGGLYWLGSPRCMSDAYFFCSQDPFVQKTKAFNDSMMRGEILKAKPLLSSKITIKFRGATNTVNPEGLERSLSNSSRHFSAFHYKYIEVKRGALHTEVMCDISMTTNQKKVFLYRYNYVFSKLGSEWRIISIEIFPKSEALQFSNQIKRQLQNVK